MEDLPPVTLRLMRPADAEAVARMVRRAWAGRVAPDSSGHLETAEKVLADLEHGRGFVAEAGGEVVASVRWVPHPGEEGVCEVHKLGVLPGYRKLGLGPKLLGLLEEDAARHGVREVRLAVRHDQYRLVEWYSAQGYVLDASLVYSSANPRTPPPFVLRKRLA